MKWASLGDAIRGIRKSRGETMAEFARVLGIDQGTISKYESGKVVPRRSVLLLLLPLTVEGTEEREVILNALGITSGDVYGLSTEVVQDTLEKYEEYLKAGGPKMHPTRGDNSLVNFAKAAGQITRREAMVEPSLVEILRYWIDVGHDKKTHQIFKNAALYIDIELKALAARRKR